VAQDVIVAEDDCGTTAGIWVGEPSEKGLFESLAERIIGRYTAADVADPKTGEVIVERGEEVTEDIANRIIAAGLDKVYVRSALTCMTRRGICALCYGRDLSHGKFVKHGEAVGIIAAQSIGEPGTQLTMRTFHTGGVAGLDITSGLPRVEELFEARVPKGSAIIAEIDGTAELIRDGDRRTLRITSVEMYRDDYQLPKGAKAQVKDGQDVEAGAVLAKVPQPKVTGKGKAAEKALAEAEPDVIARTSGQVSIEKGHMSIIFEERESRDYGIPAAARLRAHDGDYVHAGQALTEGPLNPQDILRIQGPEAVQIYLVEEVQKVYRSQGVTINDKHIETIVRQMLRRVRVDSPGDTALLPGELVDRFKFETENASVLAAGGEPATAQPVLLGVTKASLNTDSFLAAASFQETTRVLTEAAISGQVDRLMGLKENVIIGKLIPARAEVYVEPLPARVTEIALPAGLAHEEAIDLEAEDWESLGEEEEALGAEDLLDELRGIATDELEGGEVLEDEIEGAGMEIKAEEE
jgi:DNA-directed RNA polymerase subunit beta'